MIITQKKIYLGLLLLWLLPSVIFSQLFLQDDFQFKNDTDWYWRADGNQVQPTVHDGLLHLKLLNTLNSEYCNTEIYNPTEPYSRGTEVRIRLKASNIHNGSRGWGFWDGYLDTLSLLYDYDVAWVMQQGSDLAGSNYNWFFFGSNSDHLYQRQVIPLNGKIVETEWNTYKIYWGTEKVVFYTNDIPIFETSKQIPDQNMRVDIWIDNRVININSPGDNFNSITENSEMFVDFVEVTGLDGPSIPRKTGESILIWDSPNSFPNGEKNHLWKEYEFSLMSESEILFFLTGSAESYSDLDNKDELKIVIDQNDYGWNNSYSLNGENLNGKGKSIVLDTNLISGNHKVEIYSNTTPFLRDVIVISREGGKTSFMNNYDETAPEESGLWKTIDFNSFDISDISLIVSGTGEKDQALRMEIDGKDYGSGNGNSINGTELNGTPNTIVINDELKEGSHQIKIFNKGAAQLYSIAAYLSPKLTTSVNKTNILNEEIILRASPNPFNNSTIINYRTNKPSQNHISIYNTLGQRVHILLNKFQDPGEYNLSWDATGHSSGLYFCILESDKYFRVQKLLLIQ